MVICKYGVELIRVLSVYLLGVLLFSVELIYIFNRVDHRYLRLSPLFVMERTGEPRRRVSERKPGQMWRSYGSNRITRLTLEDAGNVSEHLNILLISVEVASDVLCNAGCVKFTRQNRLSNPCAVATANLGVLLFPSQHKRLHL